MSGTTATADAIFESLRSFYWSSITTEVANLILAYREIINHHKEPSSYETQNTALGGPHFERFCSIWGKLTCHYGFRPGPETEPKNAAPHTRGERPLDSSSIHHQALEIAESRYFYHDNIQYKRARSLLKVLGQEPPVPNYPPRVTTNTNGSQGILDIDHLQFSMGSSVIGRHNHHPRSIYGFSWKGN